MKKLVILVGIDGRPSMKGTYSKMTCDSDLLIRRRWNREEYMRVYEDHSIENFKKVSVEDVLLEDCILIRWGNRIEVVISNVITYNKSANINNATNKKLSREIFLEKGVNSPKLFNLESNKNDLSFPIIARPSHHAKGKNFIILKDLREFVDHIQEYESQGWYYSEFIDKVQEFRVHCGHGKILNMLEKPKPEGATIAWNRAVNHEAFDNVKWSEYNHNVSIEALKAIESVGLDFGGVDVVLDKDSKAFVLEVNTSPTLASSEYSMTRYALYFDWLAKTGKRREHWDFRKFKKTESLAWKNMNFRDEN